jgi:hypothetical protein
MPSGEQEMERSTYILFVKQCGDMYKSVTASKRLIKTFQECQLFFWNKNQNIKKPHFPHVTFSLTNSFKKCKKPQVFPKI